VGRAHLLPRGQIAEIQRSYLRELISDSGLALPTLSDDLLEAVCSFMPGALVAITSTKLREVISIRA
jgi:hypothetical protein